METKNTKQRKFKLSFITPTAFIRKYQSQGDFVLALSHLIDLNKINDYEKAILDTKLPILCDNGLFENHKPESLETLIEKALRIKATHFFAPDILYSSAGTRKELDKTIKKVRGLDIKIAAVVQADNSKDYIDQLINFNNDPNVDLIGLSILSIPKSFEKEIGCWDIVRSRVYLMQKMCELTTHQGIKWKNMHLLGLGNSYIDVIYATKYCPWIVSNDTSSAFWNATQGKAIVGELLEVQGGKTEVKVDFDLKSISPKQEELVQKNINQVKKIIKNI